MTFDLCLEVVQDHANHCVIYMYAIEYLGNR